jgi:hypothetical protein
MVQRDAHARRLMINFEFMLDGLLGLFTLTVGLVVFVGLSER